MIKKLSRAGLIVFVLWSIIVFLWERVGDIQQAEDFFNGQGAFMQMIGRLALAPWFAPAVAVICLLIYLGVEQDAGTFGSLSSKRKNEDLVSVSDCR